MKRKVLFIDPWFLSYSKGLLNSLKKYADLTLITNNKVKTMNNITIKNFYKVSNFKIKKINILFKGVYYIRYWQLIKKYVNKNNVEIIHFQWLLKYNVDYYYLKKLKNICQKRNILMYYTAHNPYPHSGKYPFKKLKKIYSLFDKIIVHGKNTRDEIIKAFNINIKNFFVQPHGTIDKSDFTEKVIEEKVDSQILQKFNNYKGKKILFLGNIFHNKGVDWLMEYWNKNHFKYNNDLLIIAGKIKEERDIYKFQKNEFMKIDNKIYIDKEVSKTDHDYLFLNSDLIVMPYRKASMSGVIFSAALFSKPILTTKVGDIPEYFSNKNMVFLAENNYKSISINLDNILSNKVSRNFLNNMGVELSKYLYKNYNWEKISKMLYYNLYKK
jgi:glycosyltransferase involved in cell wall biosynthesis